MTCDDWICRNNVRSRQNKFEVLTSVVRSSSCDDWGVTISASLRLDWKCRREPDSIVFWVQTCCDQSCSRFLRGPVLSALTLMIMNCDSPLMSSFWGVLMPRSCFMPFARACFALITSFWEHTAVIVSIFDTAFLCFIDLLVRARWNIGPYSCRCLYLPWHGIFLLWKNTQRSMPKSQSQHAWITVWASWNFSLRHARECSRHAGVTV